MSQNTQERDQLDHIARNSLYGTGANAAMIRYCFRILERHLVPGSLLELGPAEGVMTELIQTVTDDMTLVDGSEQFCASLRQRFPRAEVVHALFEEYAPRKSFDTIVLGHVLEHVVDPAATLRQVRGWLRPQTGRVFAAVPNARSLHRQAAVIMGLLPREDALNDRDRHHGHRCVFNPESFRNIFGAAGLSIEIFGGYWLKPLSIPQIEQTWSPQMLEAFMQLGERYPDIAGEIYVVAKAG